MKSKQKLSISSPIFMTLTILSLIVSALFPPLCVFFVLFSLITLQNVVRKLGVKNTWDLLLFWAVVYISLILIGIGAFIDSEGVGYMMVFGGYFVILALYGVSTAHLYRYHKVALGSNKFSFTKTVLDRYISIIFIMVFLAVIFSLYILPFSFKSGNELRKDAINQQTSQQADTLENIFAGSSLETKLSENPSMRWYASNILYVELEKYLQGKFADVDSEVHARLINSGFTPEEIDGIRYGKTSAFTRFTNVEMLYSRGAEQVIVEYQFVDTQSCSDSTICNNRKKNEKGKNLIPLSNLNNEAVNRVTVKLLKEFKEQN